MVLHTAKLLSIHVSLSPSLVALGKLEASKRSIEMDKKKSKNLQVLQKYHAL